MRALAVTLDRSVEPDVRRYSRAHHTELERALQGLSAAERRTLFESAFPGLGEGMERGWQSWERRPVGPATAYG